MKLINDDFSLRSRYLFIDSSIYHSNNFQFLLRDLEALTRLLNLDQASLILTSITVAEVKRHLRVQSKEAASAAQSFRTKGKVLRNIPSFSSSIIFNSVSAKEIEDELVAGFECFLSAKNVEVVSVDVGSAEKVFERYFSILPPFSEKKPDEFRDAFVLEALRAHADENNIRIHVVSTDNDMRAYCEDHVDLFWSGSLEEIVSALTLSVREEPIIFAERAYGAVKHIFLKITKEWVDIQDFGVVLDGGEKIYDYKYSVGELYPVNERVFHADAGGSVHGVDFEFKVSVEYSKAGEYLGYLSERDTNPTYQKEIHTKSFNKVLECQVELSFAEGDTDSVTLDDWDYVLVDGDDLMYPFASTVVKPAMHPEYE